jgi:hypothetical protein
VLVRQTWDWAVEAQRVWGKPGAACLGDFSRLRESNVGVRLGSNAGRAIKKQELTGLVMPWRDERASNCGLGLELLVKEHANCH